MKPPVLALALALPGLGLAGGPRFDPGLARAASGAGAAEAGALQGATILDAACARAGAEEEAGAFAAALADLHACAARAPGTREGVRAAERAGWLSARSEGGFAPLARLERVRRDPAVADDPAAVEALARDAEDFPPGTVRVEARLFVAEAWLGRMHRPADAIAELRRITGDPAADPLTARLAQREIVEALAADGDPAAASREARAHAGALDPGFVRAIAALARRRWVLGAAFAVLAAFAALSGAALIAARRRRDLAPAGRALRAVFPVALGFAVFLGLAGGALASGYESGNAIPFVGLGAAVLPLVLLARAWAAVGSPSLRARAGRAALCAACVLATAFVVLDAVNPTYLDGFGL